jgi:hypothetical protein
MTAMHAEKAYCKEAISFPIRKVIFQAVTHPYQTTRNVLLNFGDHIHITQPLYVFLTRHTIDFHGHFKLQLLTKMCDSFKC